MVKIDETVSFGWGQQTFSVINSYYQSPEQKKEILRDKWL